LRALCACSDTEGVTTNKLFSSPAIRPRHEIRKEREWGVRGDLNLIQGSTYLHKVDRARETDAESAPDMQPTDWERVERFVQLEPREEPEQKI
jgi:hypothetical protein